jgi:nucleotide-binding universal stress UspA family protein
VRGLHDAALAFDASQLVIGSTHRGPLLRVMPGGIGERLLHAAPCALSIAPRGYTGGSDGIRRLGVAFVDSPEAREALEAAAAMLALGGGELTVHTVLEPLHDPADRALSGWVAPPPRDERSRIERARSALRLRIPAGIDADLVVEEGDPADRLAAASEHLDLLVCGSRGYGPLRTVLLGGVSGRLAHTAACPLMVLPRAADRVPVGQSAA